jgi:threonine dehydrogenase-like Zn-dependent dehydrogenase
MRAITTIPGVAGSARLEQLDEPSPAGGPILVETLAVGVWGTDRHILDGSYGTPPPGHERLVLGHESLGRVLEAPAGAGLSPGDLVVGIVRRPDPVPCRSCAAGEWDMCENGRYVEHGIKGLDGFAAERFRLPVGHAVRLERHLERAGVLLEPASVVAKAWQHVDHIARRSSATPRRALVTGAGPIGLLAALLGRQRGLEIDVLDRIEDGPKPRLVAAVGARYHTGAIGDVCRDADVIVECTGVAQLVFDAMRCIRPNGIVCLTGLSSGRRELSVDVTALNRALVLENNVVFGTVSANRAHFEHAATALARADRAWLEQVITRRVQLARWQDAFGQRPDDVKTVISFEP